MITLNEGSRQTTAALTPSGGNVFRDLGFDHPEAENLLIRSDLMIEIARRIKGLTQIAAAKRLGVSQPRVSDLTRGKTDHFTIDALVNMLATAGVRVRIVTHPR